MTPSPLLTQAPCDPHVLATIRGRDPTRATSRTSTSCTAGIAMLALATLGLSLGDGTAHAAESAVGLGTARSFAVLAATTVTNTGPSVISGDVGVSPGTAITGFAPVQVTNGTLHRADAVADQAQADSTIAYNDAAGRSTTETVTADLADQSLAPGVYTGPTLALNGTLTLDADGDPNAVFVFQAGSTLKTGPGSRVSLVDGADACNVFWQVGSSATLGTTTTFVGTVLARTSITANTNASVAGRLLALDGAVTLDTNRITSTQCSTTTPGSTGGGSGNTSGGTTSGGDSTTGDSTTGGDSTGGDSTTGSDSTTGTGGSSTSTSGGTGTGSGGTTGGSDTGTDTGSGSGASSATTGGADAETSVGADTGSDSSGLPLTGAPIALLVLVGMVTTVLGIVSVRLGRRRRGTGPAPGVSALAPSTDSV